MMEAEPGMDMRGAAVAAARGALMLIVCLAGCYRAAPGHCLTDKDCKTMAQVCGSDYHCHPPYDFTTPMDGSSMDENVTTDFANTVDSAATDFAKFLDFAVPADLAIPPDASVD